MRRLWIVAAVFMATALSGSPALADLLVADIDTVDPLSDVNPAVWSGSDQNPSNTLVNSNPETEEAWGEAILGLTTDLVFIDKVEFDDADNVTNLIGYDPDFAFQYAIVKYDGWWALYLDSDDNNLLDAGPFDFAVSHVTFFNPDGVSVPEPSVALLLGAGLVGIGAFARARRRRE